MAGAGVLVAGGTGALGAAVVEDLLEAGRPVTATWVVESERDRVEAALGHHDGLTLRQADLLDTGSAAEAVGAVEDLGALVNLVGGFGMGPKVGESEPEEFERMIRLNLIPAYNLARAGMPAMARRGGGSFVCVSARAAVEPFAGAAGYVTGKAAVLAFVRALAEEYRDEKVRANAVLPSVIDTPANRDSMPDADHDSWVPPAEIARVIRFLASEDSAPTSGAGVPVYGRA